LTALPEDMAFLALDAPPPVRSLLSVRGGSGEIRALEVAKVFESPHQSPQGVSGCLAHFVGLERLERMAWVGTEGLSLPGPDAEEP